MTAPIIPEGLHAAAKAIAPYANFKSLSFSRRTFPGASAVAANNPSDPVGSRSVQSPPDGISCRISSSPRR